MKQPLQISPFRSFWQAGYECADQLNYHGNRVDLLAITGHDVAAEEDYQLLAPFNIRTVREGIRWSVVERVPFQYDWSEVIERIRAGQRQGIQQLWDICHFGFPDYLSPLHPHFTRHFEALCQSFAELWKSVSQERLIVTPINEVSFLAWLGGDRRGTVPYCTRQGWEVKYELVKAYIAGIRAIRAVLPDALIMTTEPLINIVPVGDSSELIAEVQGYNESQFESVDMILGRKNPELGGSEDLLDILGFNFYYNNQWTHPWTEPLFWELPSHPLFTQFSVLIERAYRRYQLPVVLSETSHIGTGRGEWIGVIAQECQKAIANGVPLWGVCLYPILDRPDWDNLAHYHNSGLWDLALLPGAVPQRVLCEPYAHDLLAAQQLVGTPKKLDRVEIAG